MAQFNQKTSFHFPQVFPLMYDRSVWHNGKPPGSGFIVPMRSDSVGSGNSSRKSHKNGLISLERKIKQTTNNALSPKAITAVTPWQQIKVQVYESCYTSGSIMSNFWLCVERGRNAVTNACSLSDFSQRSRFLTEMIPAFRNKIDVLCISEPVKTLTHFVS